MDWLIANLVVGMMLGKATLWFLNMREFDLAPSRRTRQHWLQRMSSGAYERLSYLLPGSWSVYQWNPANDPVTMVLNTVIWLIMAVGEVNSFFLIGILKVPRDHPFNSGRQAFLCLMAVPAMEEWYEYTRHTRARWLGTEWYEYTTQYKGRKPRIGHFTWLLVITVSLETAAIVKYSISLGHVRSAAPGPEIWLPWAVSGTIFAVYFAIHCCFFYSGERLLPAWLRVLKWISCLPLFGLCRLYAF
jgi:hypothetical protein